MVYCDHCCRCVDGMRVDDGHLCCEDCGKLLEDYYFSSEPTFVKNSAGQSKLSGNLVRGVHNDISESRARTIERAKDYISNLSRTLGVDDASMVDEAVAFYTIGLEQKFTKGRKSEHVQAACLYIAFRDKQKPYLLIEFSNCLRTNVYALGAVFLQLCKLLRLQNHPIVQKLVDPSLFISKFTNNLLKQRNIAVSNTALNIIVRMKRDWMQTGRKPGGICGAALYMAALAHGFTCSKSDILRIVHVCEATLTKRLVEFEDTESSSLTIDELNAMAKDNESTLIKIPNGELDKKDLLCQHKEDDEVPPHFALGLCETCYKDFVKLSGGLDCGHDPPAFQHAERERTVKSQSEENANQSADFAMDSNGAYEGQIESHASEPERIGRDEEYVATKDGEHGKSHIEDDMNAKTQDESESLSDIEDKEVDGYLYSEEEKQYKKKIWEFNNREYLEEQAIKEAAAAAERRKLEEELKNCSPETLEARKLKSSVAADVAKSKKEARQKRAQEAKNLGPAQSAVEATSRMLKTKRLSSKVNSDVLEKLFDKPEVQENHKKARFDSPSDNDDNLESKSKHKVKEDDMEPAEEFVDDVDMVGEYGDILYPENGEYETYEEGGGYRGYDEYDGYDGF
ncbi:transcription factor IIIB 90 kDa subunit-like isoform X1 [Trifolium pratense]|uniref:transcription factor IIIB 90 kDa subunit-like isoform X1 n=2 Tax=Trifolium pratense TaxID=57577 RepID=UPI001E691BF7|nr:transcription factor IIIB 90 kDa subunit-like isoform X1 [Trifolium pratense]